MRDAARRNGRSADGAGRRWARATALAAALGLVLTGCSGGNGKKPGGRGGAGGNVGTGGSGTGGAGGARPPDGAAAMGDAAAGDRAVSSAPSHILPVIQLTGPAETADKLTKQKVPGTVKIIEQHDGTHKDLDQQPVAYQSPIALSLRGNVAFTFPQKSFSFELQDDKGAEKKDNILGFPREADFALVACWTDKPCMRNVLSYALSRELGKMGGYWAPRTRFVEVLYNGVYQGLYQMVELPRADDSRVKIPKPGADKSNLEALSGGYIFRREGLGKNEPMAAVERDWVSRVTAPGNWPHQLIYTYHYPDEKQITPDQSTYLHDYVAQFEEMMKGPDWADPGKGYRAWLDVPTWVDFLIVTELSNNVDGYWKSVYFTKQRDAGGVRGKLSLQPVWDFNIAWGNADYRAGWRPDKLNYPEQLASGGDCDRSGRLAQGPPLCDNGCCGNTAAGSCRVPQKCFNIPHVPFYWERLHADASFRRDLKCRWNEVRKPGGPLDKANLDRLIDEWKGQLLPNAVERHFTKWTALKGRVWPNPYLIEPATAPKPMLTSTELFEHELKWMREFIAQRLTWLDANLPGACPPDTEKPAPDGGAGADRPLMGPPGAVDLRRGLVGYWKLDETAGTTAADSSGKGNNGMLLRFTDADWMRMAGRKGGGLSFDPMRLNVIVVPDSPSVNPTTGITIAAWLKTTDWGGNRRIIQKGNGDNQYRVLAEDGWLKFHIAGVRNGILRHYLPKETEWHHIACTWDGKQMFIYVDGVPVAIEDAANVGAINVTADPLHIGHKMNGSPAIGDTFSGVLDEVVLYDRGLNQPEVNALFRLMTPM
jgi:hypothetical protein